MKKLLQDVFLLLNYQLFLLYGHETDFTISDFVADLRAPTPSAAAELAVTDINELQNDIYLYQRRMKIALKRKKEIMRLQYEKLINSKVYKEPFYKINDLYLRIDNNIKSIQNFVIRKFKDSKLDAVKLITKLDTLSPLKTLTRGYSLVEYNKKIISKSSELEKDMEIEIKFQDGSKNAKIL